MHEIDKILEKVYLRLHNFLYNKCGCGPNIRENQGEAYNVLTGISVRNIKHAKSLIVACKTIDFNTQKVKRMRVVDGKIYGFVTEISKMPIFHLFIWYKDEPIERYIIAQNPYKNTKTAEMVRKGVRLSWVVNPQRDNHEFIASCTEKDCYQTIR